MRSIRAVECPGHFSGRPKTREAIRVRLLDRIVEDLHRRFGIEGAMDDVSRFMVEGMPNPARFLDGVTPLIERASRGRKDCVVRAYGEMVDVLWKAGQTVAAVRLDTLWNQLAQSHAFALLCGYSMGHFYKDAAHREICGLHTHVSSDPPSDSSLVH